MNSSNIKTIAAFILGAGMGSIATYYILKERLESRFSEEADEKIDSIKRRYKEKEEKLKTDKPDILEVAEKVGVKDQYDQVKDQVKEIKKYNEAVENLGYSNDEKKLKNYDISIITMDQFDDEATDFEKIPLTFYKEDATLADEEDTALNAILHIGQAGLEEASDTTDDVIYVRNFKTHRDYEISIEDGSYSEIVGEEYPERDE